MIQADLFTHALIESAERDDVRASLEAERLLHYMPHVDKQVRLPIFGPVIHSSRVDSKPKFRLGAIDGPAFFKMSQVGGLRCSADAEDKLAQLRERVGMRPTQPLIVGEPSRDEHVELVCAATWDGTLLQGLECLQPDVVFGPDMSVYSDGTMPTLIQGLNVVRAIQWYALAVSAGLPAVPVIGWNPKHPEHLEAIGIWLRRNGTKVTHLGVNAQTGGPKNWQKLAEGMAVLEQISGVRYHWFVFGGPKVLAYVFGQIPPDRVTLVCASAYHKASRQIWEQGIRENQHACNMAFVEECERVELDVRKHSASVAMPY